MLAAGDNLVQSVQSESRLVHSFELFRALQRVLGLLKVRHGVLEYVWLLATHPIVHRDEAALYNSETGVLRGVAVPTFATRISDDGG